MSNPKQQHLVPQFILRNFVDKRGQFHYFRKQKSKAGVVVRNPKTAFRQRHIYSERTAEQAWDASLEDFYSRIESDAAPRISTIVSDVRKNKSPSLSRDDSTILTEFVYHQWTRVADVMDPIVSNAPYETFIEHTKSVVALAGGSMSPEQEQQLWENQGVILHNARVKALRETSHKVLVLMKKFGLTIAHIAAPTCGLVIGSNPVVTNASILAGKVTGPDLGLTFPVASDIALVFHAASPGADVILINSSNSVARFNDNVFDQSSEAASQSRSVLLSLASRRGYDIS